MASLSIRNILSLIKQRNTARLQALLKEIHLRARDLYKAVGEELREELKNLTDIEVDIAAKRLNEVASGINFR